MFPTMSQQESVENESQGSKTFYNTRNKFECSNHDLFSEGLKLITNQRFMQIIKCNSLMKNIEQVSCSNDQKKNKNVS
jgi:hypothetical protein